MTQRIIRWLLLFLLVLGVYSETGKFTALTVLVIFCYQETGTYLLARWSWVWSRMEGMLVERVIHEELREMEGEQ